METTVVLLKPDCLEKQCCGEVLKRLEALGLSLRGCKMMRLSPQLLRIHYSHLAAKPFFPQILEFMQSTPVIALALAGDQAVARVRELIGPTDSKAAPTGSVRGDLGADKMRNVVHASDSPESAATELERFFADSELF